MAVVLCCSLVAARVKGYCWSDMRCRFCTTYVAALHDVRLLLEFFISLPCALAARELSGYAGVHAPSPMHGAAPTRARCAPRRSCATRRPRRSCRPATRRCSCWRSCRRCGPWSWTRAWPSCAPSHDRLGYPMLSKRRRRSQCASDVIPYVLPWRAVVRRGGGKSLRWRQRRTCTHDLCMYIRRQHQQGLH